MRKTTLPVRGFTLVEILVVVAIIMILAAILLPVLSLVRERGRAAVCLSNLRQLGLAMQLYTEDSGKYPVSTADLQPPNPMSYGWGLKLMSYVKDRAVYRCPSAPALDEPVYVIDGNDRIPIQNDHAGFTSYAMNVNAYGLAPQSIRVPSQFILLLDSQTNTSLSETNGNMPKFMLEQISRHAGMINFYFADGHAKPLQHAQTWWKCATPPADSDEKFSYCPNS